MVQHPTMIEVGTLNIYLSAEDLTYLLYCMDVADDGYAIGENERFQRIYEYLEGKEKEYQRRMKDAK